MCPQQSLWNMRPHVSWQWCSKGNGLPSISHSFSEWEYWGNFSNRFLMCVNRIVSSPQTDSKNWADLSLLDVITAESHLKRILSMQIHFKLSSIVLHFEDNQINQKELREKTNIRLEWKKSSKNKTMRRLSHFWPNFKVLWKSPAWAWGGLGASHSSLFLRANHSHPALWWWASLGQADDPVTRNGRRGLSLISMACSIGAALNWPEITLDQGRDRCTAFDPGGRDPWWNFTKNATKIHEFHIQDHLSVLKTQTSTSSAQKVKLTMNRMWNQPNRLLVFRHDAKWKCRKVQQQNECFGFLRRDFWGFSNYHTPGLTTIESPV